MRPLPDWLPAPEVQALIAAAEGELHVWLHLAWAAGPRTKESTESLTWDRLRLSEEPGVYLKGKGGDERLVPLYPEAAAALRGWQEEHQNGAHVFSYTCQGIRDRLKVFGRRHGHPGLYPRHFRRAFCVALIDGGADIISVRDLMGHKDVRTTLIYYLGSEPDRDKLRQSVIKGLPRALAHAMAHPQDYPDLRPHREGP